MPPLLITKKFEITKVYTEEEVANAIDEAIGSVFKTYETIQIEDFEDEEEAKAHEGETVVEISAKSSWFAATIVTFKGDVIFRIKKEKIEIMVDVEPKLNSEFWITSAIALFSLLLLY